MIKNKNSINQIATRKNLIIVIGLILSIICIISITSIIHDNNIKATIQKSKTEQETFSDDNRRASIAVLVESGVTASSQPDYSSKLDVCYVTHSDQGWIASNWYQDCYIRYVDLFSTTLERQDIDARLKDKAFGMPYNTYQKVCDTLYEQGSSPTLSYLNWQVPVEQQDEYNCQPPKPTQGLFTTRGPILLDTELSTRADRTFDPADVDKSKHYIALQQDIFYYHESLGCGFGFLCPSPRAQPITSF